MLYLTHDTWYQYLTPVLIMLYLTHDTWHQYLPCYIWHMIPYTGTCHTIFDTWYLTPVLACYIWHMITDTGTFHAIFDTWYRTPVLAMLYLTLDIWHRYLTCYTCHLIYDTGTWHMLLPGPSTLDLILCLLTGYYYTWHLYYLAYSWLLYCYQIFGTPELLYSWTPEKGWLLILYSWYYTPVNSLSWIIMIILYTLVDIIFGQYI